MKQFNVIIHEFNRHKFEPYDILPHLRDKYEAKKVKPKTFEEWKKFILDESMYQWWSRCEYEIILADWPCEKDKKKIDIHMQVEMNIDVITEILMNEYDNKD